MKTTQFTPGPWKLNENRSNDFLVTITTANETQNVCLVYREPLRALAEANARLIAQAPAMYYALNRLGNIIQSRCSPEDTEAFLMLNDARAILTTINEKE